jgi:preprotein translocase subunit SecY
MNYFGYLSGGPGTAFSSYISGEVQAAFVGVMVVIGLVLMWKRQALYAVGVFAFTILAAVFVFSPKELAETLAKIGKAIIGVT